MKRYLLGLLLCLIHISSFAQKTVNIHRGNDILMYFTSEIDSIANDSNGSIRFCKDNMHQEYNVNEIDSVSLYGNQNVIYEIPSEYLNDWDEGLVLSNRLCLLNKVDTLETEHLAFINSFTNEIDKGIAMKYDNEGKIISIESSEISFYFSYDRGMIIVHSISSDGIIEEYVYSEQQTSARTLRAPEQNTNNNALTNSYENLQNFFNNYADKFANSDTPYLRYMAEELRNLPENLMRDGIVKGLSKLFGKSFDIVDKVLKYLEDNDKRRVAFGNCFVSLQGVSESKDIHYIKGTLQGINELPNYGDQNTELKYGILGRYVGSGNDKSLPTTHWNDYKWEWSTSYQSVSSINISQELPKLSFGWYGFRSYEERFGVVKYCAYYWYFNPELEDVPEYTISNVQSRYVGDNKIEVSFTCSFNPIRTDILLYQGIELKTKDGEKITSFGAGNYTTTVKKTFDASLFEKDYTNFVATMEIDAQFWYVPHAIGKTYYKDLETKSVTYDQKPSITFTGASIIGKATGYNDNNEIVLYRTYFSFDFDVVGTFWFTDIQFQIHSNSTNWNTSFPMQSATIDGSYSTNASMDASPNTDVNFIGYYQMYLNNGKTIRSTNSLVFRGSPSNPSVSVGSAPAQAPTKAMKQTSNQEEINASLFFESMIKK